MLVNDVRIIRIIKKIIVGINKNNDINNSKNCVIWMLVSDVQ